MSIIWILAAFLLLYMFTSKVISPNLESQWAAESFTGKVARAGTLAAVRAAQTFSGLAAIVFGSILLIFFAISLVAPAMTLGALQWLHGMALSAQAWTKAFSTWAAQLALWLALIALAYYSYLVATRRLRDELERAYRERFLSLSAARDAGRLVPLPPNRNMIEAGQLADSPETFIQFPPELSRNERKRILEAARLHFRQVYDREDIDRRIDLSGVLSAEKLRGQPLDSFFERRLAPLVERLSSRGAERLAKSAKKLAGHMGMIVACVAVVGVSAPAIAGIAIPSTSVVLTDLIAMRTQDMAISSLQALVPDAPPACPKCDEQDFDDAADAFLHHIAQPVQWHAALAREAVIPAAEFRRAGAETRAAAGEALMREFEAATPRAASQAAPAQRTSSAPAFESAISGDFGAGTAEPRPAVRRVAKLLSAISATSERARTAVHGLAVEWRTLRSPWSVGEALLGATLDPLAEAALPDPANAAFRDKRAWKVVRKGFSEATIRAFQVEFDALARAAVEGRPLSAVLRSRAPHWQELVRSSDIDGLRAMLATAEPPSVPERTLADPPVDAAERELRRIAATVEKDAVYGKSAKAGMNARFGESFASRDAAVMGRTFRVGGVVLGALPDAVSYSRLEWRQVPSGGEAQFDLWLVDPHGAHVPLGTHSAALIFQALAYAADGRPLAATILNAGAVQRVMLHPALLDTQLGCDAILVDKFVFDGSENDTFRKGWRSRLDDQLRLYEWAAKGWEPTRKAFGTYRKWFVNAFPPGWDITDARQSIFAHHPNAFDRHVTEGLLACRDAHGEAEVRQCLARIPTSKISPAHERSSGVRDGDTHADPAHLASMVGAISRGEGLAPLTFVEQIAFAGEAECRTASCGTYNSHTWQFPMFGPNRVPAGVEAFVALDARRREALDSIRRFALLQRVFRGALTGRFGDGFDVAALVRLARATRAAQPIPFLRTPRLEGTAADARSRLAKDIGPGGRTMLQNALASSQPLFADRSGCH